MKSKQILIVDDDRDFAESMAEMIELEGYTALLAYNGEEALEKIHQHGIELVLMDVRMPGIDGIDTFKKVCEMKLDVRVAMMTGHSDSDRIAEAFTLGAVGVLRKPVEIDELLSTIESSGKEEVILIVDDDKDFSDSLKSTLIGQGYKVHIAVNSYEALNFVQNDEIKLMLLDLRLAETSGLEVYRKLEEHGASVPTIVVTAYSHQELEQIEELKSLSVGKVFQKPFDPGKLFEAIEAARP